MLALCLRCRGEGGNSPTLKASLGFQHRSVGVCEDDCKGMPGTTPSYVFRPACIAPKPEHDRCTHAPSCLLCEPVISSESEALLLSFFGLLPSEAVPTPREATMSCQAWQCLCSPGPRSGGVRVGSIAVIDERGEAKGGRWWEREAGRRGAGGEPKRGERKTTRHLVAEPFPHKHTTACYLTKQLKNGAKQPKLCWCPARR